MKEQLTKSEELLDQVRSSKLDTKSKLKFNRVLNIMSLGSLHGLNTLSQILSALHISSNNLHKIWQDATYKQIQSMVKDFAENKFKSADSIFQQWLKNMPKGEQFAKFFSGQYHKTVYGFRVTLVGVALGNAFHPLYFQVVPKGECTKKAALKLLKKVNRLITKTLEQQDLSCPNLSFSVDSGFTDKDLIEFCESNNIRFVGVPKKNHKFQIGRYDMKLKDYIEKVFLRKEQQYLAKCKTENIEPQTFWWRKKATYQSQARQVTLLFFRFNGSDKVIYQKISYLYFQSDSMPKF